MKDLTPQLRDESVFKWEYIIADISRFSKEEDSTLYKEYFYITYWKSCGFCKAVRWREHTCETCDLYIKRLCDNQLDSPAKLALIRADQHQWMEALSLAQQVLDAIKAAQVDPDAINSFYT